MQTLLDFITEMNLLMGKKFLFWSKNSLQLLRQNQKLKLQNLFLEFVLFLF